MPRSGRRIARLRHEVLGASVARPLNRRLHVLFFGQLPWPLHGGVERREQKMLMPETLSPTRATISEESGTLRVSIPMRRDWVDLVFLAAWLGFWIFLGRSSFDESGKSFGLVWRGFWILAAVWVLHNVLRKMAGRDVMTAGTKMIGVRKEILGIGITQQYDVAEIHYFHFEPARGRGKSYRASHIEFDCGDRTAIFGAGISQEEAAPIVSLLAQRYGFPGPARLSGVTIRRPGLEGLGWFTTRRGYQAGLVLLAVCLGLLAVRMSGYLREAHSARWPVVEGVVVDSGLAFQPARRGPVYMPSVHYRYRVGNRDFTGSRLDFHTQDIWHSRQFAERKLGQYPAGKGVSVSYDPSDPSFAVLEAGLTGDASSLIYLNAGFLALFAIGFIYLLVTMPAERPAPARSASAVGA